MLRFVILEVVLPLLLLLLVRSILRSLFSSFRTAKQPENTRRAPSVPAGGELKKDPVCGTYVSTSSGLTRQVNGEVVYFCSKECRDKFAK